MIPFSNGVFIKFYEKTIYKVQIEMRESKMAMQMPNDMFKLKNKKKKKHNIQLQRR